MLERYSSEVLCCCVNGDAAYKLSFHSFSPRPLTNMAPHKRARTSSSPSSSAAAAPKITQHGGEAHHSSLAALWRKDPV